MAEYPILFNGEMVRAILDGRKTMTRRVIRFPKGTFRPNVDWVRSVHEDGGGNWVAWSTDEPGLAEFTKQAYPYGEGFRCPYGQPGDTLYLRETWRIASWDAENGDWKIQYKADMATRQFDAVEEMPEDAEERLWIQCGEDMDKAGIEYDEDQEAYKSVDGIYPTRWRTGRFMFKAFARIKPVVTEVRVERVQDISLYDIAQEGYPGLLFPEEAERIVTIQQRHRDVFPKAIDWFRELWDSINLKSGHSWDKNDWVWVTSFEQKGAADA